ncbi:MAG: TonB family protein, partial [Myxococcota bacterium]
LAPLHAQQPADEDPPPLTRMPELLEYIQAPYPPEAEAAGREGTVKLLLEIDEAGEVTTVELLEAAGHGFDEAATDAAWQFLFTPAEDANGPTGVAIEFDYSFVLQAAPQEEETPQELPVNLEGTVVEKGTRRDLADIAVQVTDAAETLLGETTTDRQGRYQFRGVPVGDVRVRAFYPGYQDVIEEVEVTEGEVTDLRVWIKNLSYRDDEVVGLYEQAREPEVTRRTLTVEEIRRVPGTFGDPVRVIQSLPGAARGPFGSGALIIRGSNPEDSRVYVDGVEVPLIYHLGGIVSVLNADTIEAVDYLPGGYRPKYGRGMGGVIDVRTTTEFPERDTLSWSTDLIDSGGLYTGRVGKEDKWGVAVGARRSYIDAILAPLSDRIGLSLLPRWYDYQLKVAPLDLDRGDLSLFVFGFRDELLFSAPEDTALTTERTIDNDLSARYGTHRAIVHWAMPLGESLDFWTTAAVGIDRIEFDLTDDFRFSQDTPTFTLRAELPWRLSPAIKLRPGVDAQSVLYNVQITLPFSIEQLSSFDEIGENETSQINFDGWGFSPDPYLDLELTPLQDREVLLITAGARWTTQRLDNYFAAELDPRLAVRWQATEGGTLKGGSGLYHQPPLGTDLGFEEDGVTIGLEQSWSSELGWEQRFSPALQADVTVFHRSMTDRIVSNPAFGEDASQPPSINAGLGRVNGMEFMVRRAPVDRFFGWLSYTLSKSERKDSADQEEWVPFDFDQTNILVAVAGYRLPFDIGVSARAQYVTGNPYSPLSGGIYDIDQDSYLSFSAGAPNSERQPDYLAVDGRIDKLFSFKRWQLELYTDLLNVVKGENPEDIQYNYDYTESAWVTGLPFVPSPGFNATFHL